MAITVEQYRDNLLALQEGVNAGMERITVTRAGELLATIKNRITRDGKNSSGQQIGHYSTKPMYATAEQFDKKSAFKPGGKAQQKTLVFSVSNRKKKKVSVKSDFRPYSSMYLAGGYKELRNIQGKPVDKVNLLYRGDLVPNGYQMQAEQNAVLLGLISERFKIIREGLEKKFGGAIFKATSEEMDTYNKQVVSDSEELHKLLLG